MALSTDLTGRDFPTGVLSDVGFLLDALDAAERSSASAAQTADTFRRAWEDDSKILVSLREQVKEAAAREESLRAALTKIADSWPSDEDTMQFAVWKPRLRSVQAFARDALAALPIESPEGNGSSDDDALDANGYTRSDLLFGGNW